MSVTTPYDLTDINPSLQKLRQYSRSGRGRQLALAALKNMTDSVERKQHHSHLPSNRGEMGSRPTKVADKPVQTSDAKSRNGAELEKIRSPKRKLQLQFEKNAEGPKPQTTNVFHGIQNIGNSCYLNSVLQALVGLDSFTGDMQHPQLLRRQWPQNGAYSSLLQLILKIQNTSQSSTIDPSFVKASIDSWTTAFLGYMQHDAHELLCSLLDRIQEEVFRTGEGSVEASRKAEMKLQSTLCPTTKNFSCIIQRSLTCNGCLRVTTSDELFRMLSLDIPERQSRTRFSFRPFEVQNLLQNYFMDEVYESTCEGCGFKSCTVRRAVKRLPRILCLHVKRFAVQSMESGTPFYTKNTDRIAISRTLNLDPCCSPQSKPPLPLIPNPIIASVPDLPLRVPLSPFSDISNTVPVAMAEQKAPTVREESKDDPYDLSIDGSFHGKAAEEAESMAAKTVAAPAVPGEEEEKQISASMMIHVTDEEDGQLGPLKGYTLRSMVCHLGGSMMAGHYVTHVRDGNLNGWRYHDDALVESVSEESVFQADREAECYLLFYEYDGSVEVAERPRKMLRRDDENSNV